MIAMQTLPIVQHLHFVRCQLLGWPSLRAEADACS